MKRWTLGMVGIVMLLSACGSQTPAPAEAGSAAAQAGRGRTIVLGRPGVNAQRLSNGSLIEPVSLGALRLAADEQLDPDGSITVPLDTTDPNAAQLLNAQPGDNIVSAPTAGAPEGFVREVTSAAVVGDSVVLGTAESSLEESVETLDVDEDYQIATQSLQSVVLADGSVYTLKPEDFVPSGLKSQNMQPQGTFNIAGVNKAFSETLASCAAGDAKISGSLDASVKGFLNVKIGFFSLKKVEAGVTLNETAKLTLESPCPFAFSKEVRILTLKYGTHVIWAGIIPIVVTPTVELYVGANGQVSSKVKFEVVQTINGRFGVGYYKGSGVSAIKEFTNSFTHTLDLSGAGTMRGFVGAKAGITFYGVAFAYGYPKAFLEGRITPASAADQFDYCLDAGLSIGVGARLRVFGKTVAELTSDLGETRTQLACGVYNPSGTATPPPVTPPPVDPPDPVDPRDPGCRRNPNCNIP